MTSPAKRRGPAKAKTDTAAAPPAPDLRRTLDTGGHSAIARRVSGPRSLDEAEEIYVAARDAWTKAMRAANSGRAADMALLGLAQEEYEVAAAERERWLAGPRVAINIESEADAKHRIEAAIGQEMRWRTVLHHEKPKGLLGRIKRRLGGG